ncbi:hypothetical protein I9Q28_06815 [Campylobacter lari]|uniref:hypothetical protein n=1 Tax=Campylobacter lari TaxID=201 RepID=UPI0017A154AF|nr:hypothetical protein [Campylobacter lari]EAI8625112.1 hypothetical protein [Campylobacter lari]MBX1935175.1 hypothetical protein [Campylobacter lari]
MNDIKKQIEDLGPWSQKIILDNNNDLITPGKWDVKKQFDFIVKDIKLYSGMRILDCGANAGGIAFEFAKKLKDDFCKVSTIEVYDQSIQQQIFIKKYLEATQQINSNFYIYKDTIFNAHHYGQQDIVLFLGLIYHMRYPQLFLDYCSTLESKLFIFSTQSIDSKDDDYIMKNRIAFFPEKQGVMGYHPTQKLFENMLQSSGFKIEHIYRINDSSFTNNLYVVCSYSPSKRKKNLNKIQQFISNIYSERWY